MISVDWPQLLGALLIGVSGIGGIGYGGKVAWAKFRDRKPAEKLRRGADEPAPAGAQAWAHDICEAMGDASAESKLRVIQAGATRDQARQFRITELESKA